MHKLFARQLAKSRQDSGELNLDQLAELVSGAYEQADHDRRRTDRSISLMIAELDELHRGLERLVEERTATLREREDELRAQNLRFHAALNNMSQALVMFDATGRLLVCNGRYNEMYGLPAEATQPGSLLRDLLELRRKNGTFLFDPDTHVKDLLRSSVEGQSRSGLVELADGRTISILSRPMSSGGWVATHEDITERRRAEKQIAHMARHDALTDLPNRALLRERLAHALNELSRGEQLAVLYLDLDHFKSVNDTLGHHVGDNLLVVVAERLRKCVSEVDMVARVGGDEFAVIQTGVERITDTEMLARRIRDTIGDTYDLDGHAVVVDTSIGIALAPSDGMEPNELIKNADMALYRAKADGRGTYRFFEPEMDARMKERRTLEMALRAALANGEFELHYQPLVNLDDRRITCCEALLRWGHPERGMIPPADFIPIAEEIGLIIPLGEWVLRKACADAAQWPDDVRVAVNLSPIQVMHQSLLTVVTGGPGGRRAAGKPPGDRDHRIRADAELGHDLGDASSAARAGRTYLDGRLRNRLLVAELSAQLPIRQDQDRPLLHQWPDCGRRFGCHRAGDRGPRQEPRYRHDRRGCGDEPAAATDQGPGLQRDAGLPLQPAAAGERARADVRAHAREGRPGRNPAPRLERFPI